MKKFILIAVLVSALAALLAGTALAAGPNLAVADADGRVRASKTGELVGEVLPASVLSKSLPLALDG